MMPWTSSWFQDWKGTLIHKNINQNFVFTIEVTASNRAMNDMPGGLYSLAGIMIRAPRNYPNGAANDWTSNGENYVFLATGFAATNHPTCGGCPGPHFEVKNTVNSNSQLEVSSVSTSTDVQIRVARIDDAVIVLNRFPNGVWQVHRRYHRADFPSELQVGYVTYTNWQKVSTYTPFFHNTHVLNDQLNPDPSSNPSQPFNPDLVAQFDFGRFDEVEVPADLANIDLVNQATDSELLSFLGYDSQSYCPMNQHIDRTIDMGQIAAMSVQNDITSNNLILENAIVEYTAGHSIELQADFEVVLGAEFTAQIGGCN